MNTEITIAGVTFQNPVMTASGTFGSGMEYGEFVDLNRLGAVVTKGVANVPWEGNKTPRVAEVYGGMLNAIGLQNPGIDVFLERDIPFLKKFDTKIIVNVCGKTVEDYLEVVERLGEAPVDILSQREGGRYCLRTKGRLPVRYYQADKAGGKAAGDHEAESQCNGYRGNGQSGRGGRCRRRFADQYPYRNEDRYS